MHGWSMASVHGVVYVGVYGLCSELVDYTIGGAYFWCVALMGVSDLGDLVVKFNIGHPMVT